MSILSSLLEAGIPLALKAAVAIVDSKVDASKLGKQQKQILYSGYVEGQVWLDDVVESTENEYDNLTLNAAIESIGTLLSKAGVPLPVIPDAELEYEPE